MNIKALLFLAGGYILYQKMKQNSGAGVATVTALPPNPAPALPPPSSTAPSTMPTILPVLDESSPNAMPVPPGEAMGPSYNQPVSVPSAPPAAYPGGSPSGVPMAPLQSPVYNVSTPIVASGGTSSAASPAPTALPAVPQSTIGFKMPYGMDHGLAPIVPQGNDVMIYSKGWGPPPAQTLSPITPAPTSGASGILPGQFYTGGFLKPIDRVNSGQNSIVRIVRDPATGQIIHKWM